MSTIVGLTEAATVALVDTAKARANHTGTQAASTIIDFTEVTQDLMASTLVAGANVTVTYNDGAGTITIAATSGGGGSVEGIALSAHTLGAGSASANTTAINAAIAAAIAADKPLINDLGVISININDRIDMVANNFRARFNGLRLVQTVANKAGVRFGGASQDIDGLTVYNSANPASTDTDANGVEFTNCLFSKFSNLVAENWARGFFMPQAAPTIGDAGSNTVFSCNFENIRINGYAISAIDFRTWPAASAASTGNSWDNTYLHNNFFGSPSACTDAPITMRAFDESVFNQLNVEWCLPVADAMFLQECRNMQFNSLHFEGITLTGNAALLRAYFDCRVTIDTVTAKSTTIANDAGQKGIFRGYSIGGNPLSLDVTSVRVRSTVNSGARPFCLMEIEAGSTDGDCEFRKTDTDEFNGSIIVDPTTQIPRQVSRYNDVSFRNFSAPNIPIDKVRTTDKANITSSTSLVTDDVLQFPTEVGTYIVDGCLTYVCPAAADYKLRFNVSGTATGKFFTSGINTAATTSAAAQTGTWGTININNDATIGGVDVIEINIQFRGVIIVTAVGTFSIQYAQGTSNATALSPAKIGSNISYRKVS